MEASFTMVPIIPPLLTATVLTTSIVLAGVRVYSDYLAYLALGPGGTPSTFQGYLKVTGLGLFALKDPYKPACMRLSSDRRQGYFEDGLPRREGPRPRTKGIAPHRQVDSKSGVRLFEMLLGRISSMAAADDGLRMGTSCFEKHGTALFSNAPVEKTCNGEICHVHASDGSLHLVLHPADAALALSAGWGERHPLARGGWFERFVPEGFMMIYAPRNESEMQTILEIVRASAWFIRGGSRSGIAGIIKALTKPLASLDCEQFTG